MDMIQIEFGRRKVVFITQQNIYFFPPKSFGDEMCGRTWLFSNYSFVFGIWFKNHVKLATNRQNNVSREWRCVVGRNGWCCVLSCSDTRCEELDAIEKNIRQCWWPDGGIWKLLPAFHWLKINETYQYRPLFYDNRNNSNSRLFTSI